MKKLFYISLAVLLNMFCFTSCERENFSFGGDNSEVTDADGKGYINLSSIKLVVNQVSVTPSTRTDVDLSDYTIVIRSMDEAIVKSWKYSEMPDIFSLNVGTYTVTAYSHEEEPAAFEKPYYYGEQAFQIKADELTNITELTCSLRSIMVTVDYEEELQQYLGDDIVATVTVGDGTLDFAKDDTRAGYFHADSVKNNLVKATLTGTLDGAYITYSEIFSGVKRGEHRKIHYRLEKVDEGDPSAVGTARFNISIDADCEIVNDTIVVDPGKENGVDDFPTTGGEGNGENNGEGNSGDNSGEGETPSADAPTITGEGFDIENDILKTSEVSTVKVDISAPKGIANLKVTIDSPTLTEDILTEVGLQKSFDLAYPDNDRLNEGLVGLSFPTKENVIGQTNVVFDISQFIPLLGIYGSAEHHFVITVIDQAGNSVTQTLKIQS